VSLSNPAVRAFFWLLGKHGDSRKRRHTALLIGGAVVTALGLLAYGLVAPEIPFAEAPITQVDDLRTDTVVKVYGVVECLHCRKAIDREETKVGATGRNWNATYNAFSVRDASGAVWIDTTSITRMTPGPTNGDWVEGDNITVYGAVYDQGFGNLALRAQMVAKTPTDTPAVWAFWILVVTVLGALALAYVFTDRLLFGDPGE